MIKMIHKYKMNNLNIVIDVNSGSIHAVSDICFEVLDYFDRYTKKEILTILKAYSKEEVEEVFLEIENLIELGQLYSKANESELLAKTNERNPVVKALCLHVAHDCNLRCTYCFADEGEYKGKRSLMSYETGQKALEFLAKNSGTRKNLEVDFFGGEPLMNFEVVKKLVEYGRSIEKEYNKNFRFTITTNGLLLDEEKLKYINENMVNIVLSIDGRKNINDNMRKTIKGTSSYDIIVPKFQDVANSRNQEKYYVRGTFTRNNLDFSKDVLHLADLGFKQISVEPVVASPEDEYSIRQEDLDKIKDEYEKLALEMLKRKEENKSFNFFHFMIDLTGGPCSIKRIVGCGAGSEYLAITPEGELYPCHQFVGDKEFLLGTVDTGIENLDKTCDFEACNVLAKDDCKRCWAKYYCSGGCGANAFFNKGNILETYDIGCELEKKRLECAIMMKFF